MPPDFFRAPVGEMVNLAARIIKVAMAASIRLRQTFANEAKHLRRKAGGYAHARQFKRMPKVVRRQPTRLGVVLRDIQRQCTPWPGSSAVAEFANLLGRAERMLTQQANDKNNLHALHAPEVGYISKGKARKPYKFGVKNGLAITHEHGLIVGTRNLLENRYDGDTLNEELEQATILLEGNAPPPKTAHVDLGYRGVDRDNPELEIAHRAKRASLPQGLCLALRRHEALESTIGHFKSDHRLNRCWLKGNIGNALHAVLCAVGYNLHRLRQDIRPSITQCGFFALYMSTWHALEKEVRSHTRKPRMAFRSAFAEFEFCSANSL